VILETLKGLIMHQKLLFML